MIVLSKNGPPLMKPAGIISRRRAFAASLLSGAGGQSRRDSGFRMGSDERQKWSEELRGRHKFSPCLLRHWPAGDTSAVDVGRPPTQHSIYMEEALKRHGNVQ